MAQELDLALPKMALGELGLKLMLTKSIQDDPQMMSMLCLGSRINKNIVDENQNESIDVFPEYSIHKIDEESRSIRQAERHDQPLKRTIMSAKCCKRNAVF